MVIANHSALQNIIPLGAVLNWRGYLVIYQVGDLVARIYYLVLRNTRSFLFRYRTLA
jgi:hypothetical protein